MQISVNHLSELLRMDRRTVTRRCETLKRDDENKIDSREGIERCLIGDTSEEGAHVTTPEAVRRLTIAKQEEIELKMEVIRKERIPLDDIAQVFDEVFQSVGAILKSSKGKRLDEPKVNEMFGLFREIPAQLKW